MEEDVTPNYDIFGTLYHFLEDDDTESLASLEDDDDLEAEPPVECILYQFDKHAPNVFYLVKWQGCPLVRSSWEHSSFFKDLPEVVEEWEKEKERQDKGESEPFDIDRFHEAVEAVEAAEKGRRTLRRLRKQVQYILAIVSDDELARD